MTKKKATTVKAKPFYTADGVYKVIAPTKTKVKSFVHEIDVHEGQRPGLTGVVLSSPVHIKKRTKLSTRRDLIIITPRRPRIGR